MGTVDPNDDTKDCFLVQHFKFDKDQNHRRLFVVGAFSKRKEALKVMKVKQRELSELQKMGLAEPTEYICSGVQRAGHKEGAIQTRMELRRMKSGWIAQRLSKEQIEGNLDNKK